MSNTTLNIIKAVLFVIAAFLAYMLYRSIQDEIDTTAAGM